MPFALTDPAVDAAGTALAAFVGHGEDPSWRRAVAREALGAALPLIAAAEPRHNGGVTLIDVKAFAWEVIREIADQLAAYAPVGASPLVRIGAAVAAFKAALPHMLVQEEVTG